MGSSKIGNIFSLIIRRTTCAHDENIPYMAGGGRRGVWQAMDKKT
jgi:hypothetical protein